MQIRHFAAIAALALTGALLAAPQASSAPEASLPRTADGKPNLARHLAGVRAPRRRSPGSRRPKQHVGRPFGRRGRRNPLSAVGGREESRELRESAEGRSAGASATCPASLAIMYLDFPFQIFQTPRGDRHGLRVVAGLSPDPHRRQPAPRDLDSWMGDSRGHWEGDTLVVDVAQSTTTKHGSTWRETFTATRSTWSSATA